MRFKAEQKAGAKCPAKIFKALAPAQHTRS